MVELSQEELVALNALQARIGHFFKDRSLLVQALTHPSAAAEAGMPRAQSYERLEFLGDALLNASLAEMLFNRFPHEEEGVLTRLRAFWCSQPVLADAARELGLDRHLRLGAGEDRDRGRHKDRLLASALEALFAALYLDAGHRAVLKLAKAIWADAIRKRGLQPLQEDAKTNLQEARQAQGLSLPEYRSEPDGEGFVCTVLLDGHPAGEGRGVSRKAAEQAAARSALDGPSKHINSEG
jgi:ribonuclease-3